MTTCSTDGVQLCSECGHRRDEHVYVSGLRTLVCCHDGGLPRGTDPREALKLVCTCMEFTP